MRVARVTARGAGRWARGHPWIYRSDVVEAPGVEPGAVRVEDARGRFLGMALWSPASTISLRMLTAEDRAVDAGFWAERIDAAVRYREALAPAATAYRLVHGEADGLPSLVVDVYGDVLVAQFLSAGLEVFRSEIVDALVRRLEPAGILARNDVPVREYEGLARTVETLWGRVPDTVGVAEGAVKYLAGLRGGQKTGAFLDQRENRVRAGELARGRALDCFAYHGSFALHLARRADVVVAVDTSADALARAEENARLNSAGNIRPVEANVFDFLRAEEEAGAEYDIIVLDPPAFAKRRSALESALRGYKEINLRAMRLLAPGGHLCTFSCSYHVNEALFREMLESAAADAGRPVRWIEARGQAADHPVVLQIPETGYLKGAILQAT
ncbi:MAG TPA: class I SAM-dependent rRNA methyltransferase [Longimicrobiales bacterium]